MTDWSEEKEELLARLTDAERRQRQIAERYVLATAAAHVGVWDWNLETESFYLDPNIKGFLGYQDHEIPNDLTIWARYIHPDDKEAVMKAASDVIDGRLGEYVFEHRMQHKDGSERWFLVRGKVIRDERGKAIRFVGTDTDITERKRLEQAVGVLSDQIQTRIGHDLHDGLGQELTALMLKLAHLEAKVDAQKSNWKEEIRAARTMVERAIETTAALAQGLSPVIGDFGLGPGLAQLTDRAQTIYGIQCRINLPSDWPENLGGSYANHVYRIAQEALTNVARHARARTCMIRLTLAEDLRLEIKDDGIGLPAQPHAGVGLRSMRERAVELGGTCAVETALDGGTRVLVRLPLPLERE